MKSELLQQNDCTGCMWSPQPCAASRGGQGVYPGCPGWCQLYARGSVWSGSMGTLVTFGNSQIQPNSVKFSQISQNQPNSVKFRTFLPIQSNSVKFSQIWSEKSGSASVSTYGRICQNHAESSVKSAEFRVGTVACGDLVGNSEPNLTLIRGLTVGFINPRFHQNCQKLTKIDNLTLFGNLILLHFSVRSCSGIIPTPGRLIGTARVDYSKFLTRAV